MGANVGPLKQDDELLRRVLLREGWFEWIADERRWVPTDSAMSFDADGLSTYCDRMLKAFGYGHDSVATLAGTKSVDAAVFGAIHDQVATCGYEVCHSPDTRLTINFAHCSIRQQAHWTKLDYKAARARLLRHVTLTYGSCPWPPPPAA
jgi:hypothetical protein